ncbi:hypothetical protein EV187_2896 [Agromyces ramosus]|uniref:Uncharacterized protein n=1 Tax=Agromyces ramosus TaxID=33879 RepID=A0A4Q7MDT2_9MICO|nr:hypothetical protein [Agromyces ramosus]RZS64509.1 hypothetical protein EV187_2896 [Agromyces ramosus]
MNLAHGYVSQTLQTHDEQLAVRINEQRRIAAERRADKGERADAGRRPGLGHRFSEWRHARATRRIHGLPVAH